MARRPATYYTDELDITIDNKRFPIPRTKHAKAHLKMTKVRGHMRTRAEGLKSGFTKPNNRTHRSNPGGFVNICAGIANGRIKLWHELPGAWSGEVAEKLYRDQIKTTLRAERGEKRRYVILEDNDPVGYKSSKAKAAKQAAKSEKQRAKEEAAAKRKVHGRDAGRRPRESDPIPEGPPGVGRAKKARRECDPIPEGSC